MTDLGGFAAATFKRGIRFINIPTTLLSAVDAAVGGKTGVNFNGLKNEIGVFKEAETVIISTVFFSTLPERELKSGYAEMLKHGLLDGEAVYNKLLDYDFDNVAGNGLLRLVEESVNVKRRIVEQDPFEQGLRRALNLGHTAGHAFESLALKRNSPVPHGYAVAWGMVVEAVLSHTEKGFPSAELYRLADYVCRHYGAFHITCDDYPELIEFMRHDKKRARRTQLHASPQCRQRRDGLRGRRKTSGGCARHLPRLDAHIETLQPGCNNFTINLHRQKDKT